LLGRIAATAKRGLLLQTE